MLLDSTQPFDDGTGNPAHPSVRDSQETRVPATKRHMSRCIKAESPLNAQPLGNQVQLPWIDTFVCPATGCEDNWSPAEPGQISGKPKRSLNTAASSQRWKMKGDHQRRLVIRLSRLVVGQNSVPIKQTALSRWKNPPQFFPNRKQSAFYTLAKKLVRSKAIFLPVHLFL